MENKGLLWSVIIIWIDFPILYYGINTDNYLVIILGLLFMVSGIGYIVSFG